MDITEEQLKQMTPEQIKELQKKQCIFCRIIEGQVQSRKIYEDQRVLAILDINPANPGHVLLLPKEHYSIMPQMPEEEITYLFVVAKQISQSLLRALQLDGTNVFIANGQVAGQKAPHFMIHIIPRKEGDGVPLDLKLQAISPAELEKLRRHIKVRVNKVFGLPENDGLDSSPNLPGSSQPTPGSKSPTIIKDAEIVSEEINIPKKSLSNQSSFPPRSTPPAVRSPVKSSAGMPDMDAISRALLGGASVSSPRSMPLSENNDESDEEEEKSSEEESDEDSDVNADSNDIEEDVQVDNDDDEPVEEESNKSQSNSKSFDFDDLIQVLAKSPSVPVSAATNSMTKISTSPLPSAQKIQISGQTASLRPEEGVFVASKKSDRYHEPWCPFAVKVSRANRIIFKNRAEAENAGKEACECVRQF